MSKAAKQSIFILIFLLIAALGGTVYFYLEKEKLLEKSTQLEQDLTETKKRETQGLVQIKNLNEEIEGLNSARDELTQALAEAEQETVNLRESIDQISQERDRWKNRMDEIKSERDQLTRRITELSGELSTEKAKFEALQKSYDRLKDVPSSISGSSSPAAVASSEFEPITPIAIPDNLNDADEAFWAAILKQKAELEVKYNNLTRELSNRSVHIVELKQRNANLQIELDKFKGIQEELAVEIQYKTDLINNLSLELARSKNSKKTNIERVERLNNENDNLRQHVKKLVADKSGLEKTIVSLKQEKNRMAKKLAETESLIQGKIDEIWEIKTNLDEALESTKDVTSNVPMQEDSFELPPIVVQATDDSLMMDTAQPEPTGLNGKVVSINTENNFVIVNVGQKENVMIGDTLSVYRDSKYIARLEVIQVRKDISAADIKDQWTNIRVGDEVR